MMTFPHYCKLSIPRDFWAHFQQYFLEFDSGQSMSCCTSFTSFTVSYWLNCCHACMEYKQSHYLLVVSIFNIAKQCLYKRLPGHKSLHTISLIRTTLLNLLSYIPRHQMAIMMFHEQCCEQIHSFDSITTAHPCMGSPFYWLFMPLQVSIVRIASLPSEHYLDSTFYGGWQVIIDQFHCISPFVQPLFQIFTISHG